MSLRPQNSFTPGVNIVVCGICGAERLSSDVVPQQAQARGAGSTSLYVCKENERCNDGYHPQNDVGSERRTEALPRIRQ